MAEWFEVEKLKPLASNVHGHKRVIAYWPIHALDDDGDMTSRIVGGKQFIVVYESLGAGGRFEDPPEAEACGDWFGDDFCFAEQPSHWAVCIANPDGSDTSVEITAIDGKMVERAAQ